MGNSLDDVRAPIQIAYRARDQVTKGSNIDPKNPATWPADARAHFANEQIAAILKDGIAPNEKAAMAAHVRLLLTAAANWRDLAETARSAATMAEAKLKDSDLTPAAKDSVRREIAGLKELADTGMRRYSELFAQARAGNAKLGLGEPTRGDVLFGQIQQMIASVLG